MQGQSLDESMQRPCSPLHEINAEAVPPHVGHTVLLGQGRYCARWVFPIEGLSQKDEVCESPSDRKFRFLKGFEVGLDASGQY